jgi:hypothetical protein
MPSSRRVELIAEVERLRTKKKLIDECPYYFFKPWGQQVDFEKSKAKCRIVEGGERSGKTTIGVLEDIAFARGYRHDGSKEGIPPPPTKGLIIFTRREKVEKVFMPKLRKYIAEGWVTHVKNGHDGYPEKITWSNGSVQWIGAYTQEAKTFRSDDWDYVHFDEPPSREIYIAATRGLLDRGGRYWFTLTPISCPWIFNELHRKSRGVDDPDIGVFVLPLWHNPYISRKEKETRNAQLQQHEREALMWGKFSHLSGAIFPTFTRDVHVIPAHSPPSDCPIYMVMDPHDRRPSYMAWFYIDRRGRKVCFAEWPKEDFWEIKSVDFSIRDYSSIIRDVEGRWRIQDRFMDPNFGKTPSIRTGTTLVDEFWEYGLEFDTEFDNGPGSVIVGHKKIQESLRHDNRDPEILICDNCSNMIWAFETYSWNEKDMEAQVNAKERPGEEGKDQIDTLRYLIAADPSPVLIQPIVEQPFSAKDLGRGYG